MKLNLDSLNRAFIIVEIIVEGETSALKFFKKNGEEKEEERALLKKEQTRVFEVEELHEKQFWERFEGDEKIIDKLKNHFYKNGGLHDFMKECEKNMGKLNKQA